MRQQAPGQGGAHRQGGGAILAVALAPFVSLLSVFALSPFLSAISRELGMPVSVLGQIPALTLVLAGGLGLVVGPLADRWGHGRTLALGLLAAAGSALCTAAASGVWLLAGAGVLGAISRAIGQPVAQAIAGVRFGGGARRRALSLVQAAGAAAPILGVPLLTWVGQALGWRAAFLALALAATAVAALVLHLLKQRTGASGAAVGGVDAGSSYRLLLRDGPTLALYGATYFRNVGSWAFVTYLGAFLVERHSLGMQEVGGLFTCTGAGNLLGSVLAGGKIWGVPLRPFVAAANGVHLLLLGAAFALPLSVPAVAVATVASFVAMGAATVAVNTLLIGETSAGKATTMAVNQAFMSLGGASGSSLGGLLLAVGDYSAIGGAVLLCAVASPLCAWLSGRAAVPAYGIPAYLGIMWPWKWGKLSDGCDSGAVCVASRDGAVRWDRACRRKIG